MWSKCRTWVFDAAVACCIAFFMPSILLWGGEVKISFSSRMFLPLLAYLFYVFSYVYHTDISRGLKALIDLSQKKTMKKKCLVADIVPMPSRFSKLQKPGDHHDKYYVLSCIDANTQHIQFVTDEKPKVERGRVCTIEYLPQSKIVIALFADEERIADS